MTGRTVLVTGGAGFIGVPTVGRLLWEGFPVVVADDFSSGRRERLEMLGESRHLEVVELDVRDRASTMKLVASHRPWAILHLAAVHFIPYCLAHPAETLAVNVAGLQHVLDAAGDHPPAHLLFASTADVYSQSAAPHTEEDATAPSNVYGASKLIGEWLLRFWKSDHAGTDVVAARLFNVYGPRETNPHVIPDILAMMRGGNTLVLGNPSSRRDYVYVEDVAEVLVELLKLDDVNLPVNVGTGQSWRVTDLVEAIRRITGRPLDVRSDAGRFRAVDRENLQADISRMRHLLPHVVPRTLVRGLTQVLSAEGVM